MAFIPPEAYVAIGQTSTPNASEDSNMPSEGIVVAVGPSAEFLPSQIRIGERVYFAYGAGIEIDFGGRTLLLVAETELLRDKGLSCAPDSRWLRVRDLSRQLCLQIVPSAEAEEIWNVAT